MMVKSPRSEVAPSEVAPCPSEVAPSTSDVAPYRSEVAPSLSSSSNFSCIISTGKIEELSL